MKIAVVGSRDLNISEAILKEYLFGANYINTEIYRTTGSERIHWQHEKKRLWLSLIPFYRR